MRRTGTKRALKYVMNIAFSGLSTLWREADCGGSLTAAICWSGWPSVATGQATRSAAAAIDEAQAQSRLARLARASQFIVFTNEPGDELQEVHRIQEALQAEAALLRSIPADVDLDQLRSVATSVEAG